HGFSLMTLLRKQLRKMRAKADCAVFAGWLDGLRRKVFNDFTVKCSPRTATRFGCRKRGQVFGQRFATGPSYEQEERSDIVLMMRRINQRIDIRAALRTVDHGDGVSGAQQKQVHQQTCGAAVAVAEGMNRSQAIMRLRRTQNGV